MAVGGEVKFYDVEQCGFYERGESSPEFGTLDQVLTHLEIWLNERGDRVYASSTFSPEDNQNEGHLPCYCLDIQSDDRSGDYFIVLWNEVESTDGKVASVPRRMQVGGNLGNAINETQTPGDSIPGYATYFWLIPNQNTVAGIKFGHSYYRAPKFRTYVQHYMSKVSPFVVTNGEREIEGYQEMPEAPVRNLFPRFETSPIRRPGPIDELRERSNNIRQIIRVSEIDRENPRDESWVTEFARSAGVPLTDSRDYEGQRFRGELNLDGLERGEFDRLLGRWNRGDVTGRVGFKLTGEQKTRWLDDMEAKGEVEFEAERQNIEIVDVEGLFDEIQSRRQELLRMTEEPGHE
jgi:hypothetical protein